MCEAKGVIWEIKDPIRVQGERRRAEITANLLKPRSGDLILDVGCGGGYQTSYMARPATFIVGIDISKDGLKKAKSRVKDADFVHASSEKLPFRFEIFDKVICLELLEHLSNPRKTLEEIESVMKEAGTLVVSVPYRERIVATRCIHCGKLTPLWGHLHSFDEQRLSSLLPRNLWTMRHIYAGTVLAAYPLFAFLPTRLWKIVDNFGRMLPAMKPSWLISKIRKRSDTNISFN